MQCWAGIQNCHPGKVREATDRPRSPSASKSPENTQKQTQEQVERFIQMWPLVHKPKNVDGRKEGIRRVLKSAQPLHNCRKIAHQPSRKLQWPAQEAIHTGSMINKSAFHNIALWGDTLQNNSYRTLSNQKEEDTRNACSPFVREHKVAGKSGGMLQRILAPISPRCPIPFRQPKALCRQQTGVGRTTPALWLVCSPLPQPALRNGNVTDGPKRHISSRILENNVTPKPLQQASITGFDVKK